VNSGFGSIALLKSLVLPVALRSETTWDTALARLGRGVVSQFERHCSRTFERAAGTLFFCDAARRSVNLTRTPVESVTEVALRLATENSYEVQTDAISSLDLSSGVLTLAQILGTTQDQLRITYTGGWWWDTTEDSSGSLPSGATTVPDDMIMAWMLQVQHLAQQLNLFTTQSIETGKKSTFPDTDLIPAVKRTLAGYIRYS